MSTRTSKRTGKARKPIKVKRGLSANLMLTIGVVVVAAAIIVAAILISGGKNGDGDDTVSAGILRKPDSHTLTEAPDNKVTMVEFLDYQCPACAGYYRNITHKIETDYAGKITFVTRNFPLQIHPLAIPAASAAEAAALQGKYREMYHQLYDNYESWAIGPDGSKVSDNQQQAQQLFDNYAKQIGLDLNKFHQDMNSAGVKQRIQADMADGGRANISSTPTLYVNGKRFKAKGNSFGDVDRQLRRMIDKELK